VERKATVSPVSVIEARNVAEALPLGVGLLLLHGQREESRAGPVVVAPGPVMTVTGRPTERVLTSEVRDANPFFHLAESIWMLAGRDDAKFLNRYVADFGARFAESASGANNAEAGGWIHGAYGHRWRVALGHDQLDYVVAMLRRDPTSRQAVIQMWDATLSAEVAGYEQEVGGSADLTGSWRDRPCNSHIYLRIRQEMSMMDTSTVLSRRLDLTVCCRSNDAIWGAHGANAVHFSVLQEYLAARIGVGVGLMYQLSNNYHVYETELERLRGRAHRLRYDLSLEEALRDQRYDDPHVEPKPMFESPELIDADVALLCRRVEDDQIYEVGGYANPWFEHTAELALLAHRYHKLGQQRTAHALATRISDPAWSIACAEWIRRRMP